jgi:hypothetical protein
MPLAAIVEHRETIVITFYEGGDHGRDPADYRDERQDQDTDRIDGLPGDVAQRHADAAAHVLQHKGAVEYEVVGLAVDESLGLLTEICEQRRADDQKQIFEKREIKEEQREVYHHAAHDKKKVEGIAMVVLQEPGDMQKAGEIPGGYIDRAPEKIKTDTKKDCIEYARDKDPFPDLVFGDKMMGLYIRLERYDDFFEQRAWLFVYF